MVQLLKFDGGSQAGVIGMCNAYFLTLNIALRVTLEKVKQREGRLRDLQRGAGSSSSTGPRAPRSSPLSGPGKDATTAELWMGHSRARLGPHGLHCKGTSAPGP